MAATTAEYPVKRTLRIINILIATHGICQSSIAARERKGDREATLSVCVNLIKFLSSLSRRIALDA